MNSLFMSGLFQKISKACCLFVLLSYHSLTLAGGASAENNLYYPEKLLSELFQQVQKTKVLGDYKTFVDAVPKKPTKVILNNYNQRKNEANFDLKKFVLENFTLPSATKTVVVKHEESMFTHLNNHWHNLVRHPQKNNELSSLIQLPNPYVVPGGRFREMFYWDSYFTIVGLLASDEDNLALDMINNFAFMIEQFGYIPNGNRSYFLSRSQPPFFAATLLSYAEKHGLSSIIKYLPHLEKEYLFWMDGNTTIPSKATEGKHLIVLENGDYFNRYYGSKEVARAEAYGKEMRWAANLPEQSQALFFRNLRAICESGWDFSSRWFSDGMKKITSHTMDIIPVDLNSLLFQLEDTIAMLYQQQKNQEKSAFYQARATKRKNLIHKYHFDDSTGTYQDYDHQLKQYTQRLSMAMAYPLYVGAAKPQAAERVSKYLQEHFLKAGGFVTTLVNTGEQWDYPNGWAPLQYIGVQGLLKYQQKELAHQAMTRWLALNEKVYHQDGKMMEKYNVVDIKTKAGGGEYPTQDGFGWTNGVDLAFYKLLKQSNN